MKIGVLALQGDFAEHETQLQRLGIATAMVRLPVQLNDLDGLIIPGGESTVMGKLAMEFGLLEPLRNFGQTHAIWGTCAGAVLLSQNSYYRQPLLNLMDIVVRRNAFGSQADSFEADLEISALRKVSSNDQPYHAIFIRAPIIESVGPEVHVLSTLPDGNIIAAQQGKLLATSFHPELSGDSRFHEYFATLTL